MAETIDGTLDMKVGLADAARFYKENRRSYTGCFWPLKNQKRGIMRTISEEMDQRSELRHHKNWKASRFFCFSFLPAL